MKTKTIHALALNADEVALSDIIRSSTPGSSEYRAAVEALTMANEAFLEKQVADFVRSYTLPGSIPETARWNDFRDEMFQAAWVGFLTAAREWDPRNGGKAHEKQFVFYANARISKYMKEHAAATMRGLGRRTADALTAVRSTHGKSDAEREKALRSALGVKGEIDVNAWVVASAQEANPIHLNATVSHEDGETEVADTIADAAISSVSPELVEALLQVCETREHALALIRWVGADGGCVASTLPASEANQELAEATGLKAQTAREVLDEALASLRSNPALVEVLCA